MFRLPISDVQTPRNLDFEQQVSRLGRMSNVEGIGTRTEHSRYHRGQSRSRMHLSRPDVEVKTQ